MGVLNQILGGLDELKTKVDKGNKVGSNLPRDELGFAAVKTIETRGKGKFDHKRTGTEQSNGNGIDFLQNFKEVPKALLGMYQPDDPTHQWLTKESLKWEELAEALFEVHCFFEKPKEERSC